MTLLKYRKSDGTWVTFPAGATGPQGPQGEPGPGIWIGTDPPTDPDIKLWFDPDATPVGGAAPVAVVDSMVSALDTPDVGGNPAEPVTYQATPTETVTAVTTP